MFFKGLVIKMVEQNILERRSKLLNEIKNYAEEIDILNKLLEDEFNSKNSNSIQSSNESKKFEAYSKIELLKTKIFKKNKEIESLIYEIMNL